MSGLNKCPNCGCYYSYPDSFDVKLTEVCDQDEVYSAIITCQCGSKHIAGGEPHYEPGVGDGIMMFGQRFDEKVHIKFDEYPALMLTDCDENDPGKTAATYSRSLGRTIHLKPGKPKYIGRHLPCNCENYDPFDLRWSVDGFYYDGSSCIHQGGSGVLEWCTSFHDACRIRDIMNQFAEDPRTELHVSLHKEPNCKLYGLGDFVVFYIEGLSSYAAGFIIDMVEEPNRHRDTHVLEIEIWYSCGTDGYSKNEDLHQKQRIHSDYVVAIKRRSKIKYPPLNYFRSKTKYDNTQYMHRFIDELFASLPFYVPRRHYRYENIANKFFEQYGYRHGNKKQNYKLFKRWLRQNWSKLLETKSDFIKARETSEMLVSGLQLCSESVE